MLDTHAQHPDLAQAFVAITQGGNYTRPITAVVQHILQDNDADLAHQMVCTSDPATMNVWLPEVLTLFGVRSLSQAQKAEMLNIVFPADDVHTVSEVVKVRWENCNARVGRLGFSFPRWRFLAQGVGGSSLFEHFGMLKQFRATDLRDAKLPPGHPDRDELGSGFIIRQGDLTVEMRRAYVLCTNVKFGETATIVIRNNSYFFGRDRLPGAAFLGFSKMSVDDLNELNAQSFDGQHGLHPWRAAFAPTDGLTVTEKVRRAALLLDHLDGLDRNMSMWLGSKAGANHVANLVTRMTMWQPGKPRVEVPFHIAEIADGMPPWFLVRAEPAANANTVFSALRTHFAGAASSGRLALLSGPNGDLAVSAAPGAPAPGVG